MIRVVELFSGIGSQAKALSRLGVEYEVVNTCEWDYHSILAYERIHMDPEILPEFREMDKKQLLEEISKYTLSCNGKTPAPYATFRSLSADGLRAILSAIKRTRNFVSITDVGAADIPDDIDLMTYSFPCQDLSNVGAFHGYKNGIDRGAGSRSGLLWEVERILWDRKDQKLSMPRFLLMENVSALMSKRHKSNFSDWQESLEQMGYINQVYCLNALDFGLPQNRLRLFMLSVYIEDQPELADAVREYFVNHDLENAIYRSSLRIPIPNLMDYLRIDYQNPVYYQEAVECQSNDTPSRRRIWEGNLKIIDENGTVAPHVQTLTTKQDRDPNSGNLYMTPEGDRGNFRYLTPRECLLLMGFDEADYDRLLQNNVELKQGTFAFTRDRVIRMAGNSIAVNVLEYVFRQFLDLNEILHPQKHPGRRKTNGSDVHDPATRSYNMSRIKSKGTKPEDIVSRYLFNAGFRRYQRNDRELPGSPDFVIKKHHTVVFVNGCFWHGHECRYFHWPQNNADFWRKKITDNQARDQRKRQELEDAGWRVLVVWECDLRDRQEETLQKLVKDIRSSS